MEISESLLRAVIRHYSILAQECQYDRRNARVMNALRLSGKEIRRVEGLLEKQKNLNKNGYETTDKILEPDKGQYETVDAKTQQRAVPYRDQREPDVAYA